MGLPTRGQAVAVRAAAHGGAAAGGGMGYMGFLFFTRFDKHSGPGARVSAAKLGISGEREARGAKKRRGRRLPRVGLRGGPVYYNLFT